jgi:hypothetical protein
MIIRLEMLDASLGEDRTSRIAGVDLDSACHTSPTAFSPRRKEIRDFMKGDDRNYAVVTAPEYVPHFYQ